MLYGVSKVITSNKERKKFECHETTVSRSQPATRAFITNKTKTSGGSRGGARGARPPSFLDELAVKPKWNCHFKNIGRLSNNDGESNKNVPSYQNECVFLFCFVLFFVLFCFYFNSLKVANIGELPYIVLGTAAKFGLREEIEFVPVFTSSKQPRKRKFNIVFVQL